LVDLLFNQRRYLVALFLLVWQHRDHHE
jgi:hypothetical protein